MSNIRSYENYGSLDMRRYLSPEEFRQIYIDSNAKYNGKGWQTCASFSEKQLSRVWGQNVKEATIIPKASTLAVGANKPIRSTQGWKF